MTKWNKNHWRKEKKKRKMTVTREGSFFKTRKIFLTPGGGCIGDRKRKGWAEGARKTQTRHCLATVPEPREAGNCYCINLWSLRTSQHSSVPWMTPFDSSSLINCTFKTSSAHQNPKRRRLGPWTPRRVGGIQQGTALDCNSPPSWKSHSTHTLLEY
jgi:hypothetical protein